jgi:hypothetical protein
VGAAAAALAAPIVEPILDKLVAASAIKSGTAITNDMATSQYVSTQQVVSHAGRTALVVIDRRQARSIPPYGERNLGF